MYAAVVLLLAVLNADRSVSVRAIRMPDLAACEAADKAFRAPREPQFPAPTLNEPDGVIRWAHCVTLEAPGRDT